MVKRVSFENKLERFAPTPWNKESEEWLTLDQHLCGDHKVRHMAEAVAMLDLSRLFDSYFNVGKKAIRPDLLLMVALYEIQNGRPSPAEWARDVRESEPVRWLLFGMEPSRATLYDFRDRVSNFIKDWNEQVLRTAIAEKMTAATEASLDSSTVAANASRRQFLNDERLQKRRETIDAALEAQKQGAPLPNAPGWLAKTAVGLREQKERYQLADQVLRQRQKENAARRSEML